ncbi:MAG: lytic transglycosylase domain-containing protein [Rhodocyclaceae bacterium]|nr:lytic transglycosylase domain-containing protein [Rhodocyclaceae bacterium]
MAFVCLAGWLGGAAATYAPRLSDDDPPRVRAALEQAWAAESGQGQRRDEALAAALYCEAARQGSAEGHLRVGLIHLLGSPALRRPDLAKAFLSMAVELGREEAAPMLRRLADVSPGIAGCLFGDNAYLEAARFDLASYVQSLPPARREVAKLAARLAPEYGIDRRLAVAIAGVESNFDPSARSHHNARGVMQLRPATVERFRVRDPDNPEQSIRGGLAYLRWLRSRFPGDISRAVAAYNAGEGAMARHRDLPPYPETRAYVWRVLHFAGIGAPLPSYR